MSSFSILQELKWSSALSSSSCYNYKNMLPLRGIKHHHLGHSIVQNSNMNLIKAFGPYNSWQDTQISEKRLKHEDAISKI